MVRYLIANRSFYAGHSRAESGSAYLISDETADTMRLTVYSYSYPFARNVVLSLGAVHEITDADIRRCDETRKLLKRRRQLQKEATMRSNEAYANFASAPGVIKELLAGKEFEGLREQAAAAGEALLARLRIESDLAVAAAVQADQDVEQTEALIESESVLYEMVKQARWSGQIPFEKREDETDD